MTGDTPLILGENDSVYTLSDPAHFISASAKMIRQGRRHLKIFSANLDQALFNASPIIEAISGFARANRLSKVQILAFNIKSINFHRHHLIALCRRLSTSIEVKVCTIEDEDEEPLYTLVDDCGIIFQENLKHYQGWACFNHPRRVKILGQQFDTAWNKGVRHSEFRQFQI